MAALGTFTLRIKGDRIGGGAETTARLRIKTQTKVIDDDLNEFKFPHKSATGGIGIALGTAGHSELLPTDVAADAPAGTESTVIGYDITLWAGGEVYHALIAARAANTTLDLADKDLLDDPILPVSDMALYRDQGLASATSAAASATSAAASASAAATIIGLTGEDTAVAFLVADEATDTRIEVDTAITERVNTGDFTPTGAWDFTDATVGGLGIGGGGGSVDTVNGETGPDITLTAADVGAQPASPLIPLVIVETSTGVWSGDAPAGRVNGAQPIEFRGNSDPRDATDGITTPANITAWDTWIEPTA